MKSFANTTPYLSEYELYLLFTTLTVKNSISLSTKNLHFPQILPYLTF